MRAALILLALLVPVLALGSGFRHPFMKKLTVEERVGQLEGAARARWAPLFRKAGVAYPPKSVVLLGLKRELRLEVYASDGGAMRFITSFPILAASGGLGPKLKQGDRQVPEGVYAIESLNPNSRFFVSLRVGYPNDADRKRGCADGRKDLGGDIMIHGSDVSRGCLAMGDEAAGDLFVLAAAAGVANGRVILSPVDFRKHPDFAPPAGTPPWTAGLYRELREALQALPLPE